jgi:hypothetical protein
MRCFIYNEKFLTQGDATFISILEALAVCPGMHRRLDKDRTHWYSRGSKDQEGS